MAATQSFLFPAHHSSRVTTHASSASAYGIAIRPRLSDHQRRFHSPDAGQPTPQFRVRLPDSRLETFRLYFVDTTESRSRGKRSDEQAAYFGLTRAQAIDLGSQAKIFTASALAQPFTIYTRWRSVFGPTRYYAIVITSDGHDLNELLVSSGLARIPNVFLPLYNNSLSRVRFECSRLRTMLARMRATTRTNSTSVRKLPVLIAFFCSSPCFSEPELTLSSTKKNYLPR